ncbi:hypothetical protein ACFWUQ_13030 [Streptomyces sp. NPDC058662]|uniref:hypothetical protein n=1 Tax=Streptomyces sp. NPDC058662 TaxID=3346583 RepID=UPI00366878FB
MKNKQSVLATALATLTLASTAVLTAAGPAAAVDSFTFYYNDNTPSGNAVISVRNNSWGETAGYASWRQDPDGSLPGDALTASDTLPDGYGIEARLSTGRVASTRGQDSPYTVTKTGDLPEGNSYTMRLCVVKGDWEKCSNSWGVKA